MMSKLRNSLCELCTALIFFCGCSNEPLQPIRSGEIWPDNNGEAYQCPWGRSNVP